MARRSLVRKRFKLFETFMQRVRTIHAAIVHYVFIHCEVFFRSLQLFLFTLFPLCSFVFFFAEMR